MDFTIHQYLLATEPSILFATGTVQQAERSLPEIEEILGGRPLDYIFVSHMESDEYGGIRIFLERYPDAKVICSRLASRELPGLGVECDCVAADGDTVIEEGDGYIKVDDSIAMKNPEDGMVFTVITTDKKLNRVLKYLVGEGSTVLITYDGRVSSTSAEDPLLIENATSLQSVWIDGNGDVLIPE